MKTLTAFLIIAAAASFADAQVLNRVHPTPTPSPTTSPAPTTTRGPLDVLARANVANEVLPGVYGSIRWNKELGVPADLVASGNLRTLCHMFGITMSIDSGPDRPPRILRRFRAETDVTDTGGYYSCNYYLPDDDSLPHDRPLTITSELNRGVVNAEWVNGSNTIPPPGQQRTIIIIGGRENRVVTLSDTQRRARVDFEMIYAERRTPVQPPGSRTRRIDAPTSAPRAEPDQASPRINRRIDAPSSTITEGNPEPVPPNAVRIYIRYRKEYGYLTTAKYATVTGDSSPYSCNAFSVDANVLRGVPGWKKPNDEVLSSIVTPGSMKSEGNYYVCAFTITELPRNKIINVTAGMSDDPGVVKGTWQGEGEVRPPHGYVRAIPRGLQTLTLTNRNPYEIVTFEMIYARVAPLPER